MGLKVDFTIDTNATKAHEKNTETRKQEQQADLRESLKQFDAKQKTSVQEQPKPLHGGELKNGSTLKPNAPQPEVKSGVHTPSTKPESAKPADKNLAGEKVSPSKTAESKPSIETPRSSFNQTRANQTSSFTNGTPHSAATQLTRQVIQPKQVPQTVAKENLTVKEEGNKKNEPLQQVAVEQAPEQVPLKQGVPLANPAAKSADKNEIKEDKKSEEKKKAESKQSGGLSTGRTNRAEGEGAPIDASLGGAAGGFSESSIPLSEIESPVTGFNADTKLERAYVEVQSARGIFLRHVCKEVSFNSTVVHEVLEKAGKLDDDLRSYFQAMGCYDINGKIRG